MADDKGRGYELGRLVLDYIRTFMWPAVLLLVAVFYWDDLMSVVRERQVNVFGIEIGPAVERLQQVEATAQQELKDVAALVDALKASYQEDLQAALEQIRAEGGTPETLPGPDRSAVVAHDIDAKLASLQQNLGREVQQIQQAVTQAPATPAPGASAPPAAQPATPSAAKPVKQTTETRAEPVVALERQGFEAILERDIDAALDAFTEARRLWPDYHNVAEIQRYLAQLQKSRPSLEPSDWVNINRTILTEYSWGMPPDIRAELRASTAAAY